MRTQRQEKFAQFWILRGLGHQRKQFGMAFHIRITGAAIYARIPGELQRRLLAGQAQFNGKIGIHDGIFAYPSKVPKNLQAGGMRL